MKTIVRFLFLVGIPCLLLIGPHAAMAGVSAEEARKLKTTLTPLGAERAGNADGTIPAWDGGYTKVAPGFVNGGTRPDLFPDDKPLFSITAENMDQHAEKLTEGVKALLKKYPETYRLDVYKTRRTAAAPQWVYDNTFENATRGKLDGYKPINVYGGIPFPIPQSGAEAIWNGQLYWRGSSFKYQNSTYLVTANGKRVMMTDAINTAQNPYYFEDGSVEKFDGNYINEMSKNSGPPIRTGEGILGKPHLNPDRFLTYVYLTGQRRVRKLPEACCDTPTPFSSGQVTFDEIDLFTGGVDSMERFDWNILGKKEMYIPYNSNKTFQAPIEDLLGEHHYNPDHVRWELHRVWLVEATLREGKRHTSHRSIYYLDEDTWCQVLGDRWDEEGQLWRTLFRIMINVPDAPGNFGIAWGYYDLLGGAYYTAGLLNGYKTQFKLMPRFPGRIFTPQSLAGRGVR